MDKKTLFGEYSFREISREEFDPLFIQYREEVFEGSFGFDSQGAMSERERRRVKELDDSLSELYHLYIAVYFRGEFVGWSFGWQESRGRFYMCNTGILREHRGRGVYTKLLPEILAILCERGFQIVYSRHIASNNAVLVPKLRAGFVITGFDIADNHGVMAVLSYYFNPLRRKALDFRMGLKVPDEEVRKFLRLD